MTTLVGLAGGMGAGKSTVARAFGCLGVPLYLCDAEARRLTDTSPTLLRSLARRADRGMTDAHGGPRRSVIDQQGRLDRAELARRLFADQELRRDIEALVHPAVLADLLEWRQRHGEHPWVLCESAVMKTSGLLEHLDRLIVVSLPRETRIARAMARDNASRRQVEQRLDAQAAEQDLDKQADWTITPDDRHNILPQILRLHHTLCHTPTTVEHPH